MSTQKMVYLFEQGSAEMKSLLGSKGANLAEMSRIGLPVPPGFVITTEACNRYYEENRQIWPELEQEVRQCLEVLESTTGRRFGGEASAALRALRGGDLHARHDGHGIKPGSQQETMEALARRAATAACLDCYRRFIQMFGDVVLKIDRNLFERFWRTKRGSQPEQRCRVERRGPGIHRCTPSWKSCAGKPAGVSTEPWEQPAGDKGGIRFLAQPRAQVYRQANRIPDHLGTGVNVQVMVFGNLGDDSCTGVAFTRNPSTGEGKIYGEYLMNAQGEDVVSGARTPRPIAELKEEMPAIYEQFVSVCRTLESHYREMQDIEFTVEKGAVYPADPHRQAHCSCGGKDCRGHGPGRFNQPGRGAPAGGPRPTAAAAARRVDPEAKLDVIARGCPLLGSRFGPPGFQCRPGPGPGRGR